MTTPTKPKRPVGRPPRPRFPELPAFYQDKRNLKGVELEIYEAMRTRILEGADRPS